MRKLQAFGQTKFISAALKALNFVNDYSLNHENPMKTGNRKNAWKKVVYYYLRISIFALSFSSCFLNSSPLQANAQSYHYSKAVKDAYHLIMELQLDQAMLAIQDLEKENPKNLAIVHLKSYHDFFKVYTSEDPKLYKALKSDRDQYLKQIQKGPSNNPWHRYIQSDIRLKWALLKFKFGDYFSGFWEIKKANHLLEKNQSKYPDFLPNQKNLGVLHVLIGNVPDQYKWGLKILAGMDGNLQEGKKEIENAIQDQSPSSCFLRKESIMMYSFILLYIEKDPIVAWKMLAQNPLKPETHILDAYIYAAVATRNGKNDLALSYLEGVQNQKAWTNFPHLEFQLGNLKLQKLDLSAESHFFKFLKLYKGDNDIKAAYLRLAWCALLRNSAKDYERFMHRVATQGKTHTGKDKDANYLRSLSLKPNLSLIRARLLFDGGYYNKAGAEIQNYKEEDFSNIYESLEWMYRQARINHQDGKLNKALALYQEVVDRGTQQPYYFACNAALQMALIYEKKSDFNKAKDYFKTCLSLEPEIYKNSLHLSAKAGLQRIKK